MRTSVEVDHAFKPVPGVELKGHPEFLINQSTNSYLDLAREIVQNLPESADRTYALRKLLEAKQATIQAITHHNWKGATNDKKEISKEVAKEVSQQAAQ